jgi:outer membrane protein
MRAVALGRLLAVALLVTGALTIARASPAGVSLSEAVQEALASNLDLASRIQSLAAAREDVGVARSPLLPRIDLGARGQYIDAERPDEQRGNNKTGSFLMAAGLTQVVYDEGSWAGFDIQKHVYDGQVKQLEAFQLGVVQDAAGAFLALDTARRQLDIQIRNRDITRHNLEQSRARIAAGWSAEREILRWETQLAGNDGDVRAAQVNVLHRLLELNRVRNRPPEAPVDTEPATLAEYGFLYGNEPIAASLVDPKLDRRMRDYLVRVGLAHSPEIVAFDASIAAAERQLTANRRAFWVPTLTFKAGVDYLANHSSEDDFNQSEWGVKGVLSYPLLEGGAKIAGLEQARAMLRSLRTDRRALSQSLEQTIRGAFAQASGSFESVGFAERSSAAAEKNFELVDQSYTLGVASILELLDAQAQLLSAELAVNDATYTFLADLIAAERAISFYAFLEAPPDVEALLDGVARELGLRR